MSASDLKEWLAPYTFGVLSLAFLGLLAATFFEQAQLLAKYQGARRGSVATGYNNAMKLMVANRLGAVLYFFFVALAIEIEAGTPLLGCVLSLAVITAGASNGFLLRSVVQGEAGPRKILEFDFLKRLPLRARMAIFGAFAASFFNFCGLTIPMILSSSFPEFRLTLANSGFLFNSIFTLINVFLVENVLAEMIDRQDASISRIIVAFLYARFAASIGAAIFLLVL